MKANKGFTLVEIMIVVALIGLLTAIAIPYYQEHAQKGKIADATASLVEMRIRMEQHYQDNRSFSAGVIPALPVSNDFDFAYAVLGTNTYQITATGKGGMSGFAYSIDQSNLRTSTAWGAMGGTCWIIRRGQSC